MIIVAVGAVATTYFTQPYFAVSYFEPAGLLVIGRVAGLCVNAHLPGRRSVAR
jgi:hypothetical protein